MIDGSVYDEVGEELSSNGGYNYLFELALEEDGDLEEVDQYYVITSEYGTYYFTLDNDGQIVDEDGVVVSNDGGYEYLTEYTEE